MGDSVVIKNVSQSISKITTRIANFIDPINPFLRTTVLNKDEVDFGLAMCSRFGRVKHFHAWHDSNIYDASKWQTFDHDKFSKIAEAKSWLDVMEIIDEQ